MVTVMLGALWSLHDKRPLEKSLFLATMVRLKRIESISNSSPLSIFTPRCILRTRHV